MLDDHILDCDTCKRVSELLDSHVYQWLPRSLEEILQMSYDEYEKRKNAIMPLYISGDDYDHYMARLPTVDDCEVLAVNPHRILVKAGSA